VTTYSNVPEQMPRTLLSRLERIAVALNHPLEPPARDAVEQWLELLQTWNARMDLTAARNHDELCDLMLADALVLAGRVEHGARVVDVGSGAGAPGLPLALLRPDLQLTLVEPASRRVSFLRTVVGTVGARITVLRDRGENVARSQPKAWAWAVSRATLDPKAWLPLGQQLATGHVAVMLAREEPPEGDLVERVSYELPLTKAARTLCVYRASTEPRASASGQ
jgi:16S rRNA (guanine527-N7)-methyltransferase